MSNHFIKSDNDELDSSEIKPCPFCGARAICDLEPESNAYFISCIKCHCSSPLVFPCGEPPGPALLRIWNRRV